MTEIDLRHLEPVVDIDEGAATTDLLRRLRHMDAATRQRSVVAVVRGDGTFATFTYVDLLKVIEADRSIIERPLAEVLPLVDAMETSVVERIGIGIGDARDLQRDAPRGRLLVLQDAQPVGILIARFLGGDGFDLATVDEQLFGHRVAMAANGGDSEGGTAAAGNGGSSPAAPRWLSAQVHAGFEQRRRSFRSGAVNVLTVGIAPADRNLIQSDEAFPHQVPEGEVHTMDVVVWAPGLIEPPLRGQFELPHAGPTVEPARFDVDIPSNLDRVAINIDVLYQGRAVQGATLTGLAFDGADADAPAEPGIVLRRSAPTGLDPAATRRFDASLIVDGEHVLVNLGDGPHTMTLGGIGDAAEKMQNRLYTTAVAAAHETEGETAGEAVRKLLSFLAYHGHAMYGELVHGPTAGLADARTIEVTVRDAGAFFPIEFVYERGTPGPDPQVCPNWGPVFQRGETECPDCPAAGDEAPYVCPLGFWALSREIARRVAPTVSDDDAVGVATSNPSKAHPRLARLSGAVVGASVRVDAADNATSQIAATVDVAAELLGADHVVRVEDWAGWVTAVAERAPSLLLAMSHTELDEEVGAEVLQIGAGSNLRQQSVRDKHVQLPLGEPGPIVLLLGCTTSSPEIGYLGFVPAFLRQHAAVVIGTVAKVLGRHTGPLAQQFLREAVAAQGKDVPLGEVMRRTRGSMLLAGNVMGLTLTAYGNSDWLLAA